MEHNTKHEEHNINELDEHLDALLGAIAALSGQREHHEELLKIWRQPCWTTSAEFFLTKAALESLVEQAKALQHGIGALGEGAGLVGRLNAQIAEADAGLPLFGMSGWIS